MKVENKEIVMRNLMVILIVLFCLSSFAYTQVYGLLTNEEISKVGSSSIDSDEINFDTRFSTMSEFFGLITVTLDIDTLVAVELGNTDNFTFKPMYKIAGNWYLGATMVWDRLNTTEIDATVLNSNLTTINSVTHQDSLFIWVNDPTVTDNIEGLPAYDKFKIRTFYTSDTTNCKVTLRVGKH